MDPNQGTQRKESNSFPAPLRNMHPTNNLVETAFGKLERTNSPRILVGHGSVDSM